MKTRSILVASSAGLLLAGIGLVVIPVQEDPWAVRGIGALLAVGAGFLLVRMLRFATIDISSTSVVIRGILSTSRFAFDEIEGFVVVSGFSHTGEPGSALALRTRSGEVRVFGDFGSAPETGEFAAEELAHQLNERIRALRRSTDSSAA